MKTFEITIDLCSFLESGETVTPEHRITLTDTDERVTLISYDDHFAIIEVVDEMRTVGLDCLGIEERFYLASEVDKKKTKKKQ